MSDLSINVPIEKINVSQQLVFGWAYVSIKAGETEPVPDHDGHIIMPEDLEVGAYKFVKGYGWLSEHHYYWGGTLVESIVFTKEKMEQLGIDPENTNVHEGWWVGFHVPDEDLFKDIVDGKYKMLSIGGKGTTIDIDD